MESEVPVTIVFLQCFGSPDSVIHEI
jgi:hypothetical protein